MLTVLMLSANPKGTTPLRLDEELREVKEALIKRAKLRDRFTLVSEHAVRTRDVHRALLDHQPHILHFSGHGAGEGLILEDEIGGRKEVSGEAIAQLLGLFKDSLQCVVLNACYSEVQAKAISEHIPFVIGMCDAIGDKAAIEFAVTFYDAIGAGRNIKFAFDLATATIKPPGIEQNHAPVLLSKEPDAPPFLSSTTTERLTHLETLYQESSARCFSGFRFAVPSNEEAQSLADDSSLGMLSSDFMPNLGEIVFLVGELGIGKTLAIQRLYQQAIEKAKQDLDAPIPVFLRTEQWKLEQSLEKIIESTASPLGDPKTQGAIVFIDGLHEATSRVAHVIEEAERLITIWSNTTIVFTSRPIFLIEERYPKQLKRVNLLTEQEAYNLIERVSNRSSNDISRSIKTESIQKAICIPLFALIMAKYLHQDMYDAPESTGELINWLVQDAFNKSNIKESCGELLLKRLAVLAIEYDTEFINKSELQITENSLHSLLQKGLILEYGRRSIGFSLSIIKEWFASQSLIDDPSIFEKIICNPKNLERWYYPLTIIMANYSHKVVSTFLTPIAHHYPAFAARIIREGSCNGLYSSKHSSLPSSEQCGYQIREAMQAWIEGFGELSKLIAPINEDGQLQPLGINRLNGAKLEVAWYIGNEKKADVHHLPSGWMHPPSLKRQWVGGISSPGTESAWAWKWTIEALLKRLKDKLQFLILKIENVTTQV